MPSPISTTQTQIFSALVAVLGSMSLASSTSAAVPIVRGQINRVAEPSAPDFVVMWPLMRNALAINSHITTDVIFTGSISANAMTVQSVTSGTIVPGVMVWNAALPSGLPIQSQTSGQPGGAGVYAMGVAANMPSGLLYAGTTSITEPTEVTMQLDIHGPMSADNATRIVTLFRDQFAYDAFTAQPGNIVPLYAENPRQLMFENAENQIEERWSVDVTMQINPTISTPVQFATTLTPTFEAV